LLLPIQHLAHLLDFRLELLKLPLLLCYRLLNQFEVRHCTQSSCAKKNRDRLRLFPAARMLGRVGRLYFEAEIRNQLPQLVGEIPKNLYSEGVRPEFEKLYGENRISERARPVNILSRSANSIMFTGKVQLTNAYLAWRMPIQSAEPNALVKRANATVAGIMIRSLLERAITRTPWLTRRRPPRSGRPQSRRICRWSWLRGFLRFPGLRLRPADALVFQNLHHRERLLSGWLFAFREPVGYSLGNCSNSAC
jgi:hypothetical protein